MNDFFGGLGELIGSGALFAVLRPCHRPCQRLTAFDDFCQTVLLRAVEHQNSFRGSTQAELLGWLRAIGGQTCVTLLRRSRQLFLPPLPAEPPDPKGQTPLEEAAANEQRQRNARLLTELLGGLTEDERALLIRHYWHGESFADIARAWQVSANTLAQRHHRLLARLRERARAGKILS